MTRSAGRIAVAIPYRHAAMQSVAADLRDRGLLDRLYVPHDSTRLFELTRRTGPLSGYLGRHMGKGDFSSQGTSVISARSAMLVGARMAGFRPDHGARWLERSLDEALSRRMKTSPPAALVGLPFASLRTFRALSGSGTTRFLYLNWDAWTVNQALEAEAESLPGELLRREALSHREPERALARVRAEVAAADWVFVQSEHMRDHLSRLGDHIAAKVIHVPNGVDAAKYATSRSYRPGPLRSLFVGSIGYRKGVRYAVEGVHLAGPPVAGLDAVGGPWGDVRQLMSLLPAHSLAGRVPNADMPTVYANHDVLILPTLSDSMARVVLEAMASGMPVIVTEEAGYRGIVEDGVHGFIVPTRDSSAIAAALTSLARDPELRERMGAAARSRAGEYTLGRLQRDVVAAILDRTPGSLTAG